jgi:hypothetical protein
VVKLLPTDISGLFPSLESSIDNTLDFWYRVNVGMFKDILLISAILYSLFSQQYLLVMFCLGIEIIYGLYNLWSNGSIIINLQCLKEQLIGSVIDNKIQFIKRENISNNSLFRSVVNKFGYSELNIGIVWIYYFFLQVLVDIFCYFKLYITLIVKCFGFSMFNISIGKKWMKKVSYQDVYSICK